MCFNQITQNITEVNINNKVVKHYNTVFDLHFFKKNVSYVPFFLWYVMTMNT